MGQKGRLPFPSLHTRIKSLAEKITKFESLFPALEIVSGSKETPEDIVIQSRLVCQDYICEKLKTAGLFSKKLQFDNQKRSQVSLAVIAVGGELEKLHPKVYKDLSRKLNMTMRSEATVDKTLTRVLEHMFDQGEITWAKIVSMYALAGQFAVECVQQGHPEFVRVVVECIGHFVSAYLMDWIVSQGGMVGVIHAFRKKPETYALRVVTIVGTLIGLFATLAATLRVK